MEHKRRTKLVCTIGPATSEYSIMEKMIDEGMDVARLNFSHGNYEFFENAIKNLRKASHKLKKEVGILGDLQGPKIRIGELAQGELFLKSGSKINIDSNPEKGNGSRIGIHPEEVIKDIQEEDRVLLSDGLVSLKIIEKGVDSFLCEVENEGVIRSRAGVNLPDTSLSLPSLMDKDLNDLEFIVEQDLDFIALSFVRKKEDVLQLKKRMEKLKCNVPVISKIEKPEAMKNIEGIIDVSDGIMVARGDLGVECSPELVPVYQKEIINSCNKKGKFVITATQMLESMIHNPRPTRAETSDVANAIIDGTCAVMLSGETSIGKYPLEAIRMINKVAQMSEIMIKRKKKEDFYIFDRENISEGIARVACSLSGSLNASLIACLTHTGSTAQYIAKYRPEVPIIAVSDKVKCIRKMTIIWGTSAIKVEEIKNTDESLREIESKIETIPGLNENDIIILTAGIPTLEKGSTNMVKVHKISRSRRSLL